MRIRGLALVALLLAIVVAPVAGRAEGCTPGEDGCIPTPEQCSTGDFNGTWGDVGGTGPTAVCIASAGSIVLYIGGTVSPLCGVIIVGNQVVAGDPGPDQNDCGGWPAPYEATHVGVTAHDGITLDGWVVKPAGANGPMPAVLVASPYWGQQGGPGSTQTQWSVPLLDLLENGYAVALFSVRGTGNSGGCFDLNGADEQQDHADTVNWLAAQPWSNGKVGMVGLSYDGTTPWGAAINAPEALKTIVVSGTITDRYLRWHTPQGLTFPEFINSLDPTSPGFGDYIVHQSFLPPVIGGQTQAEYWLIDHAPVLAERVCPEVAKALALRQVTGFLDDRDAAFWAERRMIDRFDEVRAAVLVAHGLHDVYPHSWMEDEVWGALTQAPKRILTGQWGHSFPDVNDLNPEWAVEDWNDRLIAWLDAWLKGDGSGAPGVGVVEYQDSIGAWHTSNAWPPSESSDELLFFNGESIAAAAGGTARSYLSTPNPTNNLRGYSQQENPYHSTIASALCPDPVTAASGTNGLVYRSEPLHEPVLLAGNPFGYLRVTSDQPGGIFSVALVDLGPDFGCDATGIPVDAEELTVGGADLRFHQGNMVGVDFPTGTPVQIRVDFPNLAHVLETGHRLAVVIGPAGDGTLRWGQPRYTPRLTFGTDGGALASHVVLPVAAGTLGGSSPTLSYPPKPFVP